MKIREYWPAVFGGALTLAVSAVCGYAVYTHDGSAVSVGIIGFLGIAAIVSLVLTIGTVKSIHDALIMAKMAEESARLRRVNWPEQGKRPIR